MNKVPVNNTPINNAHERDAPCATKRPDYSASEFAQLAQSDLPNMQVDDPFQLAMAHGDHRINPDLYDFVDHQPLKPAAVLVPVIDDGGEARVILTRRTETLRKHSGQVAFAGGRVDEGDESPEAAAMREAHEEINLAPQFVTPVGRSVQYYAPTGFAITPILALVKPGYQLQANPDEVCEIFEVPLSHLMNADNHGHGSWMREGRKRHFYKILNLEQNIWGITAGMIRTIYERLYA